MTGRTVRSGWIVILGLALIAGVQARVAEAGEPFSHEAEPRVARGATGSDPELARERGAEQPLAISKNVLGLPDRRLPETPDDPPARPEQLHQRSRGAANTWTRGPFTSVQVNVDAMGNNIIGDAANEPSIAIDPTNPDRIVIGWRQFDTVDSNFRTSGYGYSGNGGQSWTFPGVLEPNVFSSDPVLASDSLGNIYYYGLQPDRGPGPWACYMYVSGDGGVTWAQEVYARGGDKAWLTIDNTAGIGSGNIYLSWSPWTSCCAPGYFTRSVDGGLTYMTPIEIPGRPHFGTLTVDPDGRLFVAGGTFMPDAEFIVARSTNARDATQTPVFDTSSSVYLDGYLPFGGGPNPGGLLGQPWVAADHSAGPTRGNIYLLSSAVRFSVADPLDVMFSRSTDGGLTWSAPIRINDDPVGNNAWQWFGTMSVAPNGRIDVVFNDTRNTGVTNLSELFYAFSEDGGVTWSANFAVSPVFDSWIGWPRQNKLGDYYHMISDNEGANLAYAATFNGEQDVYFLRIVRDCNDNGIDDDCDVACGPPGGRCDVDGCGTLSDCNANHIPDECDSAADCNTNSTQDICDIAAETSDDCNFNDMPDECEMTGNDCNTNQALDECDLRVGTSDDCNNNDTPDECDIIAEISEDCQPDDVPDECQLADFVISPNIGPCSPTANFGATWCEDFETYGLGTIQGINNWQGWGFGAGDPAAAANVSSEQNHTDGGTKSLKLQTHDTVRLFEGYNLATSPYWMFRAWIYIPQAMSGSAFFIVLADYDGGGGGTTWAVNLEMGPDIGVIYSYETGNALAIIVDTWVELRLDINFEQDSVSVFYDDVSLGTHTWSGGGGSMNLGAIDLFSPFSTGFYFDDLSMSVPLTTDCNANSVPDVCDIVDETSADCTDNGVPDGCEGISGGDFDNDGIVSSFDWAAYVGCVGGPDAAPSPLSPQCIQTCLDAFDLDTDGDVDLTDAALFTLLFSGL